MNSDDFERDPLDLFDEWFKIGAASETSNPDAMCLATVGSDGRPSARMVLLKGYDARGFVFFTNTGSDKGRQLAANPAAALCFYWRGVGLQIRVEGRVTPVTPEEADAYFASRARASRIGAWASEQSRPLDSRATLEARVVDLEKKYEGSEVPRPPYWSGYRIAAERIEFWRDQRDRLHDRLLCVRDGAGWTRSRLNP
jgi:pyridoxamine 5'-phosphate oxidase